MRYTLLLSLLVGSVSIADLKQKAGPHCLFFLGAELLFLMAVGALKEQDVENMLLEPDDILLIERNKIFLIYGEVNRTGEFILKTDMTVFKALTIAGGFTKWGSNKGVKILRLKKDNTGFESLKVNISDVIEGDANADILLKSNDVVIVSTGIF